MDPCQTVQHIANHASPAGAAAEGSASPPVQGQPGGRGAAGGAEPLAVLAAVLFGLSPDS